jgi:hypothetical protein
MAEFAFDTVNASEERASISADLAAAIDHHTAESSSSDDAPPREASPESDRAEPAESDDRSEPEYSRPDKPVPQTAAAKAAKAAQQSEPAAKEGSWADKNPNVFGRLPAEGQRYVRELERERKESAALKEHYEPVQKIFEPHADKIAKAGFTPAKLVEGWAKAETRLLDPRDRANIVAEVIHTYSVDPREVALALQEMPTRIAAAQQHQQQGAVRNVSAAIDTFAAAAGRDGRPLYPHFKELENSMTALAQTGIGAGKPHAERLKALYEAAIWASPKHRATAIAARQQQRNQAPRQQQPNGRELSLREQLEAAIS